MLKTLFIIILYLFTETCCSCPRIKGSPNNYPPKTLDGNDTSIYTMLKIHDSQRRGGNLLCLIDWESYRPEKHCWVAAKDVLDPDLVVDFYPHYQDKPEPRYPHPFSSSSAAVHQGSCVFSHPSFGTSTVRSA